MSFATTQKIGVLTATIVGMNAMIGAGIFAIPSTLANKVGPAAIISFLIVVAATWLMAQSIARVAQLYPQEGSFYAYAYPWAGHVGGLIANACYLIGLLIAMGLITHGVGQHLVHYFPTFPAETLGVSTLIFLTLLNAFGVSLSSLGQQILIALTVFPLIATTFICLTKANINNFFPFAPFGALSIFDATRVIAFAFFGFEASASLFTVIENPEKNVPKALTYSLLAVAFLYFIFIVSLILAVPLELFKQFPGPISVPLSYIFPDNKWIIEGIHLASISAILGTLHSMIWASSTLFLSFLNKLRCTPQKAESSVLCPLLNKQTCTLAIGSAIYLSFKFIHSEMFFSFTNIFLLITFVLSMTTLLFIKSEWKSGRNYLTVAGLIAVFGIFCCALMDIFYS
ncbi:amino acid permease [bacterium]|nr:amino acid permease [bacterium]